MKDDSWGRNTNIAAITFTFGSLCCPKELQNGLSPFSDHKCASVLLSLGFCVCR